MHQIVIADVATGQPYSHGSHRVFCSQEKPQEAIQWSRLSRPVGLVQNTTSQVSNSTNGDASALYAREFADEPRHADCGSNDHYE
jgi:hypothetical protein